MGERQQLVELTMTERRSPHTKRDGEDVLQYVTASVLSTERSIKRDEMTENMNI